MSHRVTTACAYCGHEHDSASAVTRRGGTDARPVNGDASLCIKCGQWNIFDSGEGIGMRKATKQELHDLGNSPIAQALMAAWSDTQRRTDG